MSIVNISVEVNQDEIRKCLDEKLDKAIREVLFVWDVEEMTKRLCMGKTFLEAEILRDPRMKSLQRQKPNSKRFWFYEPSLKVNKEIMDEW